MSPRMIARAGRSISSPERLAYWYFRLNGFLTTENFIVHQDSGRDQRTDADLLAVRFCNRMENLIRPMEDAPKVASCRTPINVVIAEVKTGTCALNGPWSNPNEGNMRRVLKAVGCLSDGVLETASERLHATGNWADGPVTIRLFAVGEMVSEHLNVPLEQQLTWDEVMEFCIHRFTDYHNEKVSVGQWADDGKRLKSDALSHDPLRSIRRSFGLRTGNDSGIGASG